MSKFADICIVIASSLPHQHEKAEALAKRLALPLEESFATHYRYYLVYTDNRLELQQNHSRVRDKAKPMYVDFAQATKLHMRLTTATIKDPLARAAGIKSGIRPSICDCTAGLGMDGMSLAWLGCRVVLIERSPVVYALLADGLERAGTDDRLANIIQSNITLFQGNSVEILPNLPCRPDTVLVDPMYPVTGSSSLNRKEMRILRDIVGEDPDSGELFRAALQSAIKRVAVKRPRGAETICETPKPTHQIKMKSGRFDVYLANHL